jgi:hypothetical protein
MKSLRRFIVSINVASLLVVSGSLLAQDPNISPRALQAVAPGDASACTPDCPPTTGAIVYHAGPVILKTFRMYLIWYGSWSAADRAIITDFLDYEGGSAYYNINTLYSQVAPVASVSNKISDSNPEAFDTNYSFGKNLTQNNVVHVVSRAINDTHELPADTNGLYLVLSDPTVGASDGFCTQFCAYHSFSFTIVGGKALKYALIPNSAFCPNGVRTCVTTNIAGSPNGNPAVDAMVSMMAHEIEEAATDPLFSAWYDATGFENADKCANNYGPTFPAGGGVANITLGARNFLIQRNWRPDGDQTTDRCAISFP